MELSSGTDLLHYRLIKKVGEGGMGVVWQAVDTTLGRDVAIKVLPERLSRDPERLHRFEREARLLASLNDPNVATIHGLERVGPDRFLVMEFVTGRTLADRLTTDGAWRLEDALPLMRQMARGLEAAHAKGIIHRDLKPSNVHVSEDGRIKILDFGLAKMIEDATEGPVSADSPTVIATPTKSGVIVGTMTYMSPEQIEGRPLDARSDLFQLGMILFEMIAGRHPFHGLTPVDVQHAILREPPHMHELERCAPDEFVRVVSKLLEKDREYRYPTAEALGVALKALHRASDSGWSSTATSGLTARRRRPLRTVGIALTATLVIVIAAVSWWVSRSPPQIMPATPSRLIPLTQSSGDSSTPSFSPDGNSIAFASNRSDNWELWVALVSGGDPIRITETAEAEFHAAWSPTGERIAYTRYHPRRTGSDIWVVPALGGRARKVCDDGADPAWAPDGRQLAFVRSADGWTRIMRMDVDGSAPPVPVTEVESGVFQRHPTWTPDGEWILFTRSQGGISGRLMRVSPSGGAPQPVTDDPLNVRCSSPFVTPDGRFVVHVSDRGGTTNLWRVPLDGGAPERITSGPGPDSAPVVSPDGKRIAFVNQRVDPRIVVVSHDDGNERLVARLDGGIAWSPVLSPDRSRILVSRKSPGQPWRIQSVPLEGGTPANVIEGEFSAIWPRFLPDGSRFVFFTWPGEQRVGMASLDGSGLTWLTGKGADSGYPDVSPDGETIAYVRSHGEGRSTEIVVRALSGGEERVVAEVATLPAFSPDGRRLAFSGSRTYTGRIGVLDLDTGERRWLTESGTWPVWMPGGAAIAYADRSEDGVQVARVASLDAPSDSLLSEYVWNGVDYPFSFDPATGDLVSTNNEEGAMRIWLAEYDDATDR